MFEESPLKLYEQELKKQEEILNSLDKNLADLKVEKGKINPQEYERLYRQDEEKINQYMNKANSKITRLSKIIAAYYNVMDANEKLDNLEKIVPRDSQDQQELEIEKKYIEEIKNKNMAILPEEIKEVFLPKTVSDIKPQTNEKIKGIDDYRTEIEQNEKEIKHLKENIEELMALKDNIPTPEYERELETLKRYKNRENGKLLRNRQIVTAYELLENNQERITYLNSLVARDEQDKREIQEELNFLKTENEKNKRFIPKTLHQSLMTMAKQDNRTNLENNPEILPVQDTGIIFQSEAESRSVNSQVMNSWTPEQPENKDILNQADAFITDDDIAQSNVPEVAVQSSNTNDQKSVSSLSLPDFLNNDQKTEENKTENKEKISIIENSPNLQPETSHKMMSAEMTNHQTMNSWNLEKHESVGNRNTSPDEAVPSSEIEVLNESSANSENISESEKIDDILKHIDNFIMKEHPEDEKKKEISSEENEKIKSITETPSQSKELSEEEKIKNAETQLGDHLDSLRRHNEELDDNDDILVQADVFVADDPVGQSNSSPKNERPSLKIPEFLRRKSKEESPEVVNDEIEEDYLEEGIEEDYLEDEIEEDNSNSRNKFNFWQNHGNRKGFIDPDEFEENVEEEKIQAKPQAVPKSKVINSPIMNVRKPKKNLKKSFLIKLGVIAGALVALATMGKCGPSKNNTTNQSTTSVIENSVDEAQSYAAENVQKVEEENTAQEIIGQDLDEDGNVLITYYGNPGSSTETQEELVDLNEENSNETLDGNISYTENETTEDYSTNEELASTELAKEDLEYLEDNTVELNESLEDNTVELNETLEDTINNDLVNMELSEEVNTNNISDTRIGSTIKIDPTAKIYSTTFDAYLDENGKSQYYQANPDRVVIGVSVLNENGLNRIYAYTEDANNKINQLINEGGEIVSILTANKEKYLQDYDGNTPLIADEVKAYAEGWYNISSVQNQKSKGVQR